MTNSVEQKSIDKVLLLRAAGISKSFGANAVLKGVSLRLFRGEIVLLRGENASGKTTLLNILTGNLTPDSGTIEVKRKTEWEKFRFPQPWRHYVNPFMHFTPESVCSKGVGRTWQDIRLFPKLSLLDNISVARPKQFGENPVWLFLRPAEVRSTERQNRREARSLLADLKLAERGHLLSDTLSLGQSKRAAIARAIHAGAKILFLDEPLAGLDEQGIDSVLTMLLSLAEKDGITLVIVEHLFHIPRLLKIADTVWTLKDGEVFEERPQNAETSLSNQSDPVRQLIEHHSSIGYELIEQHLPGNATLTILRRREETACILRVEDLIVHRSGKRVIGPLDEPQSRGLSFQLFEGDTAVLEAPNGWGKTTLMDAIMGLVPISQGQITFRDQSLTGLPTWRRARSGMAYLRATGHSFSRLTVSEIFELADAYPVPDYIAILAARGIAKLSGGQQQLVSLFRVLSSPGATCCLLDEPFNMLDHAAIESSRHLLRPPKGSCCLVAVPAIFPRNSLLNSEAVQDDVSVRHESKKRLHEYTIRGGLLGILKGILPANALSFLNELPFRIDGRS